MNTLSERQDFIAEGIQILKNKNAKKLDDPNFQYEYKGLKFSIEATEYLYHVFYLTPENNIKEIHCSNKENVIPRFRNFIKTLTVD